MKKASKAGAPTTGAAVVNPSTYPNLSKVWTHLTDFVVERGEGCYLYTQDGRKVLDFTSGIGVNSTGHCHPAIVEAVREQAGKLLFSQINVVYHNRLVELCEELKTVVPPHLDTFFFTNSGAEAIEGAVKLAKHATGRTNVIVMHGSFHGRTHLAMAMTTSSTGYRLKYAPLVAGIYVAPYPYALAYNMSEKAVCDFAISELEKVLKTQTAPEETAAIVVEPILGEGGYVVPPAGYLPRLREICDRHGILLVIDEIQSGFGRSGRFFAHEYDGVKPDIMTMAKGMGSGLPISGFAYRGELGKKWIAGSHGGTYCGSPISCAAAIATIQTLKKENLVENAAKRGEQLRAGLRKLQKRYPSIAEIRGRGLLVGVEFITKGRPDGDLMGRVLKACVARNLLLLGCGINHNVIRWIPPLISGPEQIDEGLSIFAEALKEAGAGRKA
jgi:4-aminobutyrate aminotransferase